MKASMIALVGFALVTVGTGCSAVSMQSQAKSTWETHVLADGVELRVSEDASPDASRVADDIQSELRLRYPSTQSDHAGRRWEKRVLADGVELLVSENAGANATRMAADIQTEMRSRYISAR